MNILDISIIAFFLLSICLFGLYQSYNNKSQSDFFLAGKNINWVTAMFSIVATETSVLTFISIPAIAYRGDWTFLQLSIGYIIGRFMVSFLLLPLYFKDGIVSIYEILDKSFGPSIQKLASATFLITRVLADGVRFAAIAIVIQAITGWSISLSILLVGLITLVYTVLGGLKAIIRVDAFQFIIYLISALICIYYLFISIDKTLVESITYLNDYNKLKILNLSGNILYNPFMFFSAIIGGAMLSFASHGVDYMMVQRVLATKDISSARKAMIGSGIFVLLQFALFLFVGSLLYIATDCMVLDKNQEIPYIISNILPNGMKGIVVAGILSVAMSTLSSSINSLSSSTINDWFPRLKTIKYSQIVSLFWTFILILTALYFSDPNDPLIIIDESHQTLPQFRAMYNGDRSRKLNLVEHGFRLPSALDNRPMKFDEFVKKINQTIYVSATPAEYELSLSNHNIIEQIIRPTGLLDPQIIVRKSKNQIDDLVQNIKKVIKKGKKILITTLTKRMSEDLTEHLKSLNIKAEYLHSEIDSLERVKIIRSLRLGNFDVLVGINLLREGLDLPEVSLVAVLDADKQGFLRSRSSLLQVAGRAARNVNGKVVLYGDKISDAMRSLIDETDRRRKIQEKYNKDNNIKPETILKSKDEINNITIIANNSIDKILEETNDVDLSDFDEIEFQDQVKKIERKMLNYAKELKFEEAALLRDHLDKIKIKEKHKNE